MSEQTLAFDEKKGVIGCEWRKSCSGGWKFFMRQMMLINQDNGNYPHTLRIFALPSFNPILPSGPHTQRLRLASTQHFFSGCDGTLRLFRVVRPKVAGWGQQAIFSVKGWVCVRFEKAKGGSLVVKKEIPDAEGLVFTGNFECVSMSGKVMRTAANTNSIRTHNFLLHRLNCSQCLTHGSGFTARFWGPVVRCLYFQM